MDVADAVGQFVVAGGADGDDRAEEDLGFCGVGLEVAVVGGEKLAAGDQEVLGVADFGGAFVHLFGELAQCACIGGQRVGAVADTGVHGVVHAGAVEVVEQGEDLVGDSGPGQPGGEIVDDQECLVAGGDVAVGE
ncbi:hypothetical protein [Mycobacterium kyorinense]|uniref:hypothetical protein n=1 Tax=Mycobacterium kyorinense TaxID=487514 RepID=UPI001F37881E|nr:hypothetical protein [Mycobacterium kyorinense]